jgi:hypothetical protein
VHLTQKRGHDASRIRAFVEAPIEPDSRALDRYDEIAMPLCLNIEVVPHF